MEKNLLEAERRIAKTLRTRAEKLHLGDLALRELPASLGDLLHLKKLNLAFTGVTDLQPLAGLQALQSLDLSVTGVTDLQPLASLQALQSLDLSTPTSSRTESSSTRTGRSMPSTPFSIVAGRRPG